MQQALQTLQLGVAAVGAVDPASLSDTDLAAGAVGLQRHIDRIKALHAAVIAEADRRQVWRGSGARNVADWLSGTTNTSYGDAVSRAKLGDALTTSRELKEALDNGHISAASAEQLHDAITNPPVGADVTELIDAVKGATPRETKAAADRWREIHTSETPEQAADRRYQARSVTFGPAHDGMVDTTVRLPERQSAEFRAVISSVGGKPCHEDRRTTGQRLADGLIQLCAAYAKGDVKGGREGANLLITITAEAYAALTDEPAVTSTGDRVPAHVAREIAENATIQRIVRTGSHVLDLGRSVRFATPEHYKALVARDGGCRWPGCHIPAAWCDIDHLTPHHEGGRSDRDNLVMWCRHHHTEKHRPGVTVLGDADDLRIRLADGTILDCPPNTRPRMQAAA